MKRVHKGILGVFAATIVACASPPAPPASPAPASAASARAPVAARRAPPVPAARRPTTQDFFGTRVVDDYQWLEDAKSAEVKAFTDAQNALARAYFDGVPERAAVRDRLAQLLGASAGDYLAVRATGGSIFVLVTRPPKQQPLLVVRADGADPATERVVLDPNVLDPTGKTTIDFFVPSPDKKRVAISLSKDGTESGDLHVYDVATGKEQGDVIARVHGGTAGGSVAWNAAGTGFYYTRYPRAGERPEADLDFFQQVWFHDLGTPKDALSLGRELSRISEIELERSDDGHVLAQIRDGDGGDVEHFVLRATAKEWTRVSKIADRISHATFGADGKLYAISRKGASRGKVVAFAPPFDKPPETIFPEGDGVIEDVAVTKSALYLVELVSGPSRMRRVPLGVRPEPLARDASKPKKGDKKPPAGPTTIAPGARGITAAELPLPPIASVTAVTRIGEDLLVRSETYLEPPAWYRYRASEHRLVKTAMAKAPLADMSDVEVLRETCTSSDGTKVPMSILRKKGTKLESQSPTLLTGYGGFGVSRKPRLRAWYRVWLERGGVLAEANLRGGGELGEDWHAAGKLERKQNVFDDFAACAKRLVELRYTTPARLAITGRSNGGLLMGAAITQHPELFRAVVSGVGIYDMLRTELSPNGAFNVTEYGTVEDEAQFRAMHAYSPFHRVRDGVAYPAVLFMTGANDPRVDPYHSRKMTARMQAATSSDRPILLRASADTGHGMGTPLAAEIEETTDMLAFLFHELGVETPETSEASKTSR
ncbi:MAG: S9 family peptidase [Labilithrix sp.]|nr:S9 family peptidase [Labilithrix sp.]